MLQTATLNEFFNGQLSGFLNKCLSIDENNNDAW